MVGDEEDLAGIGHDAFGGPDFPVIEIQQRAVGIDPADADDAEVDLELAEEVDDGLADHPAIPAAHDAAGDDDLEFIVLELRMLGHLQIIGDDQKAPDGARALATSSVVVPILMKSEVLLGMCWAVSCAIWRLASSSCTCRV